MQQAATKISEKELLQVKSGETGLDLSTDTTQMGA